MNADLPKPPGFLDPESRLRRGLLSQTVPAAAPTVFAYLKLVLAHKWLVLLIVGVVGVAAALVVFRMTPIFRSTATVLIETAKNNVVSIDEVYGGLTTNREYFQTQVEFLKSRDVGLRVIRDLKLVDHPLFDPRVQVEGGISKAIGSITATVSQLLKPSGSGGPSVNGPIPSGSGQDPEISALEAKVLDQLQSSLDVNAVRLSQMITVSYESPDPQLSALIANRVSEAFIRSDLEARFDITQKATTWLSERVEELRKKLDESELELQAYREKAGLIRTPASGLGGNVRQLDSAADRLVSARMARAQIEQVYRQVRPGSKDRYLVPQVLNNPAVAGARAAEAEAERRLNEVRQSLGSAHPKYQQAEAEYLAARENTVRQSEGVIASISKEYEVARSTERALEDQLNASRDSIRAINRKEIGVENLERVVATNRQLYETFLSRAKETTATADFQNPIARIIDPAIPSLRPIKPAKGQIILAALLLGFVAASCLAIFLERRLRKIKTVDEVETLLALPMLSAVPLVSEKNIDKPLSPRSYESESLFAEAVRTAVTGMQLSMINVPNPAVVFTSTVEGEGKSTMAASTAFELARTKNILLVDADFRRPTLAKRFGLPAKAPGLADILDSDAVVDHCIQRLPGSKLSILASGPIRSNPLDLLLTPKFARLVRGLRGRFDMVIFDSPPIELVSDALLIGRECSSMIYVVKSDSTEVPMIQRGIARAMGAGIDVIGVLLNAHNFKTASRYYGDTSAQGKYAYAYGADSGR